MAFETNILILAVAILADAVLGDPAVLYRRVWHPVTAAGMLIDVLDRALNHGHWPAWLRRAAGLVSLAIVVALAAGIGLFLQWLLLGWGWGWLVAGLIASTLLAQNSMYRRARDVAVALETGGLDAGRAAVAHIVGRDPKGLDEAGVRRATIESLAENFSDGVTAPLFWALLLGLPGLFAYKAINTADSMIGYRNERYADFGWAAARIDDAVNWLPARLSAFALALAALLLPRPSGWRALATVFRDARNSVSPNAGYPEAAMAGALRLKLAGPRIYGGQTTNFLWIGDGSPRPDAAAVRSALVLYAGACLVLAASILVFASSLLIAP
jgi:adenosylcobinamide-phosphate synthase